MKHLKSLLALTVYGFGIFAAVQTASAQLISLSYNGSWNATTISASNYTVLGPNFQSNSVYAGNGTTVQRWDSTATTPVVGMAYTTSVSQIVYNNNAANYSFALSDTNVIRFEPGGGTTTTSSSPGWKAISQDRGVNTVFGLTLSGQLARMNYDGGWQTISGAGINNASTGYTSVAADGTYTAGQYAFSSGGGNGLDRTYYDGSSWVFQNLTVADYDLLTMATGQGNTVFGVNSSGLARVYFSGGWQTQSINSKNYAALISDSDQVNVLFGLTASGVDRIYSTDSGSSWTTEQIYAGSFTRIADNIGVNNSLYITAVPEPSTVLAALGLGGLLAWPMARRLARRCRG